MSTSVLSVRVRRELKEEAERLGVDFRRVVEEALEESIRRAKVERLERLLKEFGEALEGVSEEEWVQAVREARDEGRA